MAWECRRFANLVYLLAVGDYRPSAAAARDPEGRTRQTHSQRHNEALKRLNTN
jgi:hypothetical protein